MVGIYCHLFLDPELVGRWRRDREDLSVEFDGVGNARLTSGTDPASRGTYRINGESIIVIWSDTSRQEATYGIEGDSLTFEWPEFSETFLRVPDDS